MIIYLSYLRAFKKYANSLLNVSTEMTQIGDYANRLTAKVLQLIKRASLNTRINLVNLQYDLFQSGRLYINRFSNKFNDKVSKPIPHYPVPESDIKNFSGPKYSPIEE